MFKILVINKNDKGVILIVVLIIIIVMSIVSATIFSQSMSQSKTTRSQVDAIVAEELAKGQYWKSFSDSLGGAGFTGNCMLPGCINNIINGRVFNTSFSSAGSNIQVSVAY